VLLCSFSRTSPDNVLYYIIVRPSLHYFECHLKIAENARIN
jgi:hypothetical protein